jgi:hypothetical protein
MSATKLILVIGATGAQGMAAIDGLLESWDGPIQDPRFDSRRQ